MSKMLQTALEEQRNYYSQKLLAIGVYNSQVMNKMTLTELKNEYNYFYHNVPNVKVKGNSAG
ncbi:Fur-regulated basic protein FbpA [Metabacillus sp. B2-18]|uniref:Fur-regulated basic protein FbpA n=1 Tax=Metabacillus sp. B2-18 TaxID=2897333 RepID=UPI001E433144|nr:Fur-regulated basic protein FbpA [Metabacillus sp. B2-18]UGB32310.1 Fur-regulated basic protein FbpA [Metabacillus sp. B2-18]